MRTLLNKITSAFSGSAEPQPEPRFVQIVSRQRGLAAASVQDRLSRQYTDPPVEEAAEPLYDQSAYVSPGGSSEI